MRIAAGIILGFILLSPQFASAQSSPDSSVPAPSNTEMDYPARPGVLIQSSDWTPIDVAMPAKTRAKGGVAQSLSYGAVRGTMVADYAGEHAAVQVKPGRVVICLCRVLTVPGDAVIVKLHPLKGGMRELDGGKLAIIGAKMAEASKNDLVPVEVSHPNDAIWLVRSQEALPEGEYALMLGTQNLAIFPFTVSGAAK